MCCICSCFASVLDLIQKTITFVLACWLACVVCCGLACAAAAGIAYGYNYSMAEFITLSSADVTVYLRRGRFHDKPELKYRPQAGRRSGENSFEGGDEFTGNMRAEDDETGSGPPSAERRSLSEAWVKAEDARKYAEWLAQYGAKSEWGAPVDSPAPSTILPDMDILDIPTRTTSNTLVSNTERATVRPSTTQSYPRRFLPDPTGKWQRTTKPPGAATTNDIFKLDYSEDNVGSRKKHPPDVIINVADEENMWSTPADIRTDDLYMDKIIPPV